MAVLVNEAGMKSDENEPKNESSHESNVYFDRQLQNKLLQFDEDSDTESYESKLSKSWSNLKSGAKSSKSDTRIEDITGWFPSAKFVGRRTDLPKAETKPANNFIHPWKDYRSKKEESFVFKHYTEFRKYMEQYRNQHACHINRFSSGNQISDMRRMAFQQSSAPPQQTSVTVHELHQPGYANSAPPTSCNGTYHYTNRKEQMGTLITATSNCTCNAKTNVPENSSQSQRYKVNPGHLSRTNTNYDLRPLDSDNSSEYGDLRYRTPSRRTNSASSTRSRTITGKTPTKISVPANPNPRAYPVQALTIAWRLQRALKARYHRQQNAKTEACPSPKPLDNLNCVAPEKQKCLKSHPELEGLTWAEKLEVLRSVNKPREKPRHKQQKLKFVKAESKDPLYTWSFEHDHLYEQRRIKHLVEQARIKGGKQLDWVYEAQVRARGVNWNSETVKENEGALSGESSEDEGAAGDSNLGKYGICVPPEQMKQRLFNSHGVNRSNTTIAP